MNRNNFLLLTRKTSFINDKGKTNGFENRTIQIHSYFNNYLTTYKRIECYLNSTRRHIPPSRIMLEDFRTWSNMPPTEERFVKALKTFLFSVPSYMDEGGFSHCPLDAINLDPSTPNQFNFKRVEAEVNVADRSWDSGGEGLRSNFRVLCEQILFRT